MESWIIWSIVIGVLLIIEVLTLTMWALCLAVGAIGGLIAALCGISSLMQIIVTAILSVVACLVLIPLFRKWHFLSVDKKGRNSRTGMEALLGRRAILSQEIRADRPGRARIDGDNWQVTTSKKGSRLPAGTEVVVTGYDSIILFVEET